MTWPIVELTFWNPGDGHNPRIDPLLADPTTPLAKHGLTGIANAYVRETGVALHDEHRSWAELISARSLAADGALHDVVDAFDRLGFGYFVAKGPTVAYPAYPHPGMRPYCDLDVYVPAADHLAAREALRPLGYEPVDQATGVLGGLGQEMHGGRFGAIVEVHGHPIDNLHRHHLPSLDAFLPHVERRDLAGVSVPVLAPAAHLALQAIHAAAGHRYAKLVLLRDIEVALGLAPEGAPSELGAGAYLAVLRGLLDRLGRPVASLSRRGTMTRPVVAALGRSDPQRWDEYRPTPANVLALLHQERWSTTASCLASLRSVGRRQEGRRVGLWGSVTSPRRLAPARTALASTTRRNP